jgi:hypothetical protein
MRLPFVVIPMYVAFFDNLSRTISPKEELRYWYVHAPLQLRRESLDTYKYVGFEGV